MVNLEFQIHKAKFDDLTFIKAIEQECKLSSWSINDYENELKRDDSIFYVVISNNEVIGYLLARLITNSNSIFTNSGSEFNLDSNFIELFNIGIKNSYRKNGLGKELLEKLIIKGRSNNTEHIFLEVRKSNEEAIRLYGNLGFEIIYERKNLYHDPIENGLGMKLTLIKNVELDMT